MISKPWFVYILKCTDATFYTGISPDVEQRVKTHNLGKASRYTRARLPVKVIYIEQCADRSEASKREAEIKKLSKKKKLKLVILAKRGWIPLLAEGNDN